MIHLIFTVMKKHQQAQDSLVSAVSKPVQAIVYYLVMDVCFEDFFFF